jgi:uncharacterized protein YbgA (DUF1722 family)/uncharacterized protein YbbK (DUF523 family)
VDIVNKTDFEQSKIAVGISACLTGMEVRYNGGHCNSKLCMQTLKDYFEFKSFCPEVVAGFGTPRPTLRLAGDPDNPKLSYSNDSQSDLTGQFVDAVSPHLAGFDGLDGYILMKNSPSCGLERIKVYQDSGYAHVQRTSGLFTKMLQQHYPLLPVEEEGRLHDDALRENFILRVYTHHLFRSEVLVEPTPKKLIDFHSEHKYLVMAHSQQAYKDSGRMLANLQDRPIEEFVTDYFELLMNALAKPAHRNGHTNVLLHMLGYLKKTVAGEARQKIANTIEDYRVGNIPLITPLTLLSHYIDMKGSDYIQAQKYFEPYPPELGLRNKL